jgi:hypothetical protein
MIVVLLLGAAVALWGATEVAWGDTSAPDQPGIGAANPGDGMPDLTAIALLALAGLAGVFAVGGWLRRILGAIFVAAGGYTAWVAIDTVMLGGFSLWTGRGFAFLGAVALLAAGALVVAHARRLPTMGARYETANARARTGDPDKDMWDGLSEGEDPTADSTAEDRRP